MSLPKLDTQIACPAKANLGAKWLPIGKVEINGSIVVVRATVGVGVILKAGVGGIGVRVGVARIGVRVGVTCPPY